MATDGQNEAPAEAPGGKKMPPWMNKAKQGAPDAKKTARAAVIQKRLANMSKKGK